MKQYLDLLTEVMHDGAKKPSRPGIDTLSVFGPQMRFNLKNGFPLVTTKKIHMKSVIHELIWLISGNTNIKYLNDNKVRIWNEWADENGDLGPVYGEQWRHWRAPEFHEAITDSQFCEDAHWSVKEIDQLKNLIDRIREAPDCRRQIVTCWNPGELGQMALAPCHIFYQTWARKLNEEERILHCCKEYGFHADDDIRNIQDVISEDDFPTYGLSMKMYIRSNDLFLGAPFNIASYALLLQMIAQCTNMIPQDLIYTMGDAHIYENHLPQVIEQLSRDPKPLPIMKINPAKTEIDDFVFEDFELIDYQCHPHIKGDVAV